MLSPKFLQTAPDSLRKLYARVEDDIIADMCRWLTEYDYAVPAVEWQYQKLLQMGSRNSDIRKKLSQALNKAEPEIKKLLTGSTGEAVKNDLPIYKAAGIPTLSSTRLSEVMAGVLQNGIDQTGSAFINLTATTAGAANQQFIEALDRVWLQVSTGAFDINSAIKMAVKDLAAKGITAINYAGGKSHSLDVAVTRAARTGVNQTALRAQERLANEFGADLVEVTAHSGARTGKGVADHAGWQGKIYSRSGTSKKYLSLKTATGYGTGAGLGGWNCRHSWFPYFEGQERVYTDKDLTELNAPKYTYNGKNLTEYEATQDQRYIERQLRRWKREYIGMDASGQSADEAAAKIAHWQRVLSDFEKQTGLKRQHAREGSLGFGRKEAEQVKSKLRKASKR